ncbi:hypothetical protein GCM10010319_04460 [Streptomyces blastmyceticus]|uniref:Uncharacterized protein n=1 Tax=Streptomyces blastmyceticus TaxID=68180 RepID=A0ABN0WB78_9ACTN
MAISCCELGLGVPAHLWGSLSVSRDPASGYPTRRSQNVRPRVELDSLCAGPTDHRGAVHPRVPDRSVAQAVAWSGADTVTMGV